MLPVIVGVAAFAAVFLTSNVLSSEEQFKKKGPNPEPPPAPPPKDWVVRTPWEDADDSPQDPEEPGPPIDPAKVAQELANSTCHKISPCPKNSSLTQNGCVQRFLEHTSLGKNFGLKDSITLRDVQKSGGVGYWADSKALSQCLEGIKKISCDELGEDLPNLNGEPPDPLGAVGFLFNPTDRPGCARIFKKEKLTCNGTAFTAKINSSSVQALSRALCDEAVTCHSDLACGSCLEGVLTVMTLGDKLGLNQTSLKVIDYGMTLGLYSVNDEALGRCLHSLRKLNCGQVGEAWSSDDPKSFYSFGHLIPKDENGCSKVFSQAKVNCETHSSDPGHRVAEALCSQAATCRPEIGCDTCLPLVLDNKKVTSRLGLGYKTTLAPSQIGAEIRQGHLTVDSTALDLCLTEIGEKTCTGFYLGKNPTTSKHYDSIATLLSESTGSCKMVLKGVSK